jgi:hypothetical protein
MRRYFNGELGANALRGLINGRAAARNDVQRAAFRRQPACDGKSDALRCAGYYGGFAFEAQFHDALLDSVSARAQ